MQTRFLLDELFDQFSQMHRMIIPKQDDFAWQGAKQLLEKGDHVYSAQGLCVRTDGKTQMFFAIRNKNGAQQVQPLVMV